MGMHKFKAWDGKTMSRAFTIEDASYEGFPRPVTDENGECNISTPVVFMQYTGIDDANGDEICAGDIVYIAGYGDYIAEFPFTELYTLDNAKDIGVIKGNIYENPYEAPELLSK